MQIAEVRLTDELLMKKIKLESYLEVRITEICLFSQCDSCSDRIRQQYY